MYLLGEKNIHFGEGLGQNTLFSCAGTYSAVFFSYNKSTSAKISLPETILRTGRIKKPGGTVQHRKLRFPCKALFSSQNFLENGVVTFSLLFDN
jgi:hypothetical protein